MKISFLIFLIQIFVSYAAKRNFRFVGLNAECHNKLPKVFESFYCFIEQGPNRTYGSGHVMFRFPIQILMTHLEVHTRTKTWRQSKIVDMRFDMCSVFKGLKRDKIFKIGTKSLKRFMNEIPGCPLKGKFNYTLSRAYLDEEDFPQYTPFGDFTMKVAFLHQSIEGATFIYKGKVVPKASTEE